MNTYLANISFNQKLIQLSWSPWLNNFCRIFGWFFERLYKCIKTRGKDCLKFWKIEKYWIWGLLKIEIWSDNLLYKYQIVQRNNCFICIPFLPSLISYPNRHHTSPKQTNKQTTRHAPLTLPHVSLHHSYLESNL